MRFAESVMILSLSCAQTENGPGNTSLACYLDMAQQALMLLEQRVRVQNKQT